MDGVTAAMLRVGAACAALKLLLFPAAYSTDLHVHRFWKALTISTPLSSWYTDTSSPWTLDYPPLFAYFELSLAHAARRLSPSVLSRGAATPSAVRFLRGTVLATDALLIPAVAYYVRAARRASREAARAGAPGRPAAAAGVADAADRAPGLRVHRNVLCAAMALCSPGLALVDAVHFQYNGLALAALLLAVALLCDGRLRAGSAAFSAALNLKHTLLPAAPVVAAYLLGCVSDTAATCGLRAALAQLAALATVVLGVFGACWGPLAARGGARAAAACLARMFPVSRGLLHAYWAPNAWAVYAAADKALAAAGCVLRAADVDPASGRIGAAAPCVCLPNPTPAAAALLSSAAALPALAALSAAPRAARAQLLPRAVAYASLCAFVFGWHVHEKMVLLATVPLGGVAFLGGGAAPRRVLAAFCVLAAAGHVALHPLVTSSAESVYKVLHYAAYTGVMAVAAWPLLGVDVHEKRRGAWDYRPGFVAVLVGCVCVEAYAGVGGLHVRVFGEDRMQFLPLMLTSAFCGVVVVVAAVMLGSSFATTRRAGHVKVS